MPEGYKFFEPVCEDLSADIEASYCGLNGSAGVDWCYGRVGIAGVDDQDTFGDGSGRGLVVHQCGNIIVGV